MAQFGQYLRLQSTQIASPTLITSIHWLELRGFHLANVYLPCKAQQNGRHDVGLPLYFDFAPFNSSSRATYSNKRRRY